jgi:hypothetical protein
VAARRSTPPLYWVYLARVINIPPVQCHREAVTDDREAQFFSEGCRPDTLDFQWSLDEPDVFFWGPVASAISPISLQAWNAAFVAFLGFINALAFGELTASGVHPNTGARCEIDPAEWMRTGLILDVRNGDLIEVGQGKRIVRWSAITLQEAEPVLEAEPVRAAEPLRTAAPERKLKRIDWDELWNEDVVRREKDQLPNEKAYVRELETRIKERYGVTSVDGGDLRRFKVALYRGDSERPKRSKRKKTKHKG